MFRVLRTKLDAIDFLQPRNLHGCSIPDERSLYTPNPKQYKFIEESTFFTIIFSKHYSIQSASDMKDEIMFSLATQANTPANTYSVYLTFTFSPTTLFSTCIIILI